MRSFVRGEDARDVGAVVLHDGVDHGTGRRAATRRSRRGFRELRERLPRGVHDEPGERRRILLAHRVHRARHVEAADHSRLSVLVREGDVLPVDAGVDDRPRDLARVDLEDALGGVGLHGDS